MNPLLVFIIIIATSAATAIDTSFQIQSSERQDLCIEVFKTLDQVGRLWLRPCKSKDEHGIGLQMFGVTNDGKINPSTKPSSCLFLYNKKLRYRKDCKKNQFMFDFFMASFFLWEMSRK